MTVALMPVKREEATRFGVAQLDPPKADEAFKLVRSFMEKPELEKVPENPSINGGVYVIDMAGYPLDLEAWFDVGTLEQLVDTSLCIARRSAYGNKNRI